MILNYMEKLFLAVVFLIIMFAKELIIINQEFFIILAFLLVLFFSMKHFLGASIKDELNARQNLIINNYLNLEKIYQLYLEKKIEFLKRSYFLVFEISKFLEINVVLLLDLLENRKLISKVQKISLLVAELNFILVNLFVNKFTLLTKHVIDNDIQFNKKKNLINK